jgi:cell division initiation protein
MAYSPEDIVAYEFRTRTRGYDRAEVDELLDALADQVERDQEDLDDLRARLRDAERRLGDALESEGALKRGLVAAQEAADRALEEAREQAAEAWAAAEREIEQQLAAAEADAQAIRAAAEAEAAERREELAALRAVDEGHRERLRAHLHEQLRLLEELPGPPTLPAEEPAPDDDHGVEDAAAEAAWKQDVAEDGDQGPGAHGDRSTHHDASAPDVPSGEAPDARQEPDGSQDEDGDDVRPSPMWG